MNKTFTQVLGTYKIPAWALNALINGDYSGLTDEEWKALDDFEWGFLEASRLGDQLEPLAGLIFNPIDEVPYFSSSNAIDGLGGDVYDVEAIGNFQSV